MSTATIRLLSLTVPVEAAAVAVDRLWSVGARAVEERSAAPELVEFRTVLAGDDRTALDRLGAVPASWQVAFVDVDAEPAETWRRHARAIDVADGLRLAPAWVDGGDPADTVTVRIEPRGSFGLGDHPTTHLCAAATWQLTRRGDRMLDVGCGSGVLAVCAAVRGARQVLAIDISSEAIEATRDNARRNGVASVVEASTTPVGEVRDEFDLVVANILAPTLYSMASDLRRLVAPGGRLVISGVLQDRYDHVLAALHPLRPVRTRHLDGWAAVELRGRAQV